MLTKVTRQTFEKRRNMINNMSDTNINPKTGKINKKN